MPFQNQISKTKKKKKKTMLPIATQLYNEGTLTYKEQDHSEMQFDNSFSWKSIMHTEKYKHERFYQFYEYFLANGYQKNKSCIANYLTQKQIMYTSQTPVSRKANKKLGYSHTVKYWLSHWVERSLSYICQNLCL